MLELLSRPWPWYVSGAMIGISAPLLLLVGNRLLGMSGTLRHMCAATLPSRAEFFRYDWRAVGGWNLVFAAGVLTGGFVGAHLLGAVDDFVISAATRADLQALGIGEFEGFLPRDLYSWDALPGRGLLLLVLGGLLVGFGAGYAGGCTSGHAITGIADLQPASLLAAAGFFAGGILASIYLFPLLF